jgi:hypothetical protein
MSLGLAHAEVADQPFVNARLQPMAASGHDRRMQHGTNDERSDSDIDASPLAKLERLGKSHGALAPGRGIASGVFALVLSLLSLLGVIGFHFPAYTSTPELRAHYDVDVLRYLMFGAMVTAGAIALTNIVFGRSRWLAASAFAVLLVAQLLGGPTVPIGDFPDHTPYIGLDFFILDLLGSTLVFVLHREGASRCGRTSRCSAPSGRTTSYTSS